MYQVVPSRKFARSLKRLKRSGIFKSAVEESFNEAVNLLIAKKSLPASYFDHQLTGEWSEYRECHLKGDLLLVYEYRDEMLMLSISAVIRRYLDNLITFDKELARALA